jgi:hypothetical protein
VKDKHQEIFHTRDWSSIRSEKSHERRWTYTKKNTMFRWGISGILAVTLATAMSQEPALESLLDKMLVGGVLLVGVVVMVIRPRLNRRESIVLDKQQGTLIVVSHRMFHSTTRVHYPLHKVQAIVARAEMVTALRGYGSAYRGGVYTIMSIDLDSTSLEVLRFSSRIPSNFVAHCQKLAMFLQVPFRDIRNERGEDEPTTQSHDRARQPFLPEASISLFLGGLFLGLALYDWRILGEPFWPAISTDALGGLGVWLKFGIGLVLLCAGAYSLLRDRQKMSTSHKTKRKERSEK